MSCKLPSLPKFRLMGSTCVFKSSPVIFQCVSFSLTSPRRSSLLHPGRLLYPVNLPKTACNCGSLVLGENLNQPTARSSAAAVMQFASCFLTVNGISSYLFCSYPPLPALMLFTAGSAAFGEIFFTWINPLMELGYKRPLTEKDIWKLDTWERTKTLYSKLNSSLGALEDGSGLEASRRLVMIFHNLWCHFYLSVFYSPCNVGIRHGLVMYMHFRYSLECTYHEDIDEIRREWMLLLVSSVDGV